MVDEPVAVSTLSEVLETSHAEIEAELAALASELEQEGRGFVLRHVAGGWRFYTAPDMAPYVERWVRGRRSGRLSRAALETLAVIAYKQPISRAEVAEIRGVNADGAMRTLVSRGLIAEVGRDDGPGQAVLYGTTTTFLEDVGLSSLSELPPLADFLPPGPAPDEPSPEHQRDARAVIRAGRGLPSTGKARWDPGLDGPASEVPPAGPASEAYLDGADLAAPRPLSQPTTAPPTPRSSAPPGDEEGELDVLTEALERATRNALTVLENALQAIDEPAGPAADGPDHRGSAYASRRSEGARSDGGSDG
ncbi:MAG: SMC-Scp complex subunit ScpB [Actinomycetota bacterium]|nr:SMC-Scp complex subunit ScpB [Actinomycetota bacterium]